MSQLTEEDQLPYKGFDMVVSAHWQEEIIGQILLVVAYSWGLEFIVILIAVTTVFDVVNQQTDRLEAKRQNKMLSSTPDKSIIYLFSVTVSACNV